MRRRRRMAPRIEATSTELDVVERRQGRTGAAIAGLVAAARRWPRQPSSPPAAPQARA
ncbi:MAG: hypothetical protein U0P45_08015 [Acidimicrobiales bacterium]